MDKQICVVGAGRWGQNHIKALHELGCLGGIVETNPETRRQCAVRYPQARTYARLEEALAGNFAGFTVATPAETHFELARAILRHQKPVLVEKPLALTANQARELKRLAEDSGVNLMVGHVMLFHPAIRKISELVRQGKIGRLQYLYSNRLNLGTVRTEENILWSFAPHDISIFQYLIGQLPEEVVSRGGAFIQPGIHDSTMTVLKYPDNIIGHIFVSWLHPFKEHRLVVIGSKGMFSFEDSSEAKSLLFYEKGIDWIKGEPIKRDGPTEVIPYDSASPLTEELRYFTSRLNGLPVETADAQNAVEVLEILERASASLLDNERPAPAPAPTPAEPPPTDYFVHATSFVDENVQIGEGTRIWHFSHVQNGARIGRQCTIGQNVNVANNVRIGNFVKIQNNVSVYEGVELEDYVFCGPSMVFTNIMAPRCKYPQQGAGFYRKTLVREGASIGANATIICGTTIGRHALIAAGTVVSRDVPDYALMVGVPGRQAGWVCECGEKLPQNGAAMTCPRCGARYQTREDKLEPLEGNRQGIS